MNNLPTTNDSPVSKSDAAADRWVPALLVGAVFACVVAILMYATAAGQRHQDPLRAAEQAQRQVEETRAK